MKKPSKAKKLAEYIFKRMIEVNPSLQFMSGVYFNAEDIEFWIIQQKVKPGHSEWSEQSQRNIWIEDED